MLTFYIVGVCITMLIMAAVHKPALVEFLTTLVMLVVWPITISAFFSVWNEERIAKRNGRLELGDRYK